MTNNPHGRHSWPSYTSNPRRGRREVACGACGEEVPSGEAHIVVDTGTLYCPGCCVCNVPGKTRPFTGRLAPNLTCEV